jgi:DNA recombination protein RmuC
MVIRMPDKRDLVVDVKTPLDAYLKAIETPNKDKQKILLQKHSSNVKDHIKKLSAKNYWDQFENSPEFVILFIPGDQFLSSALNEDTELIEFALSRQIILATPTSFIALLKAINYGWRQLVLSDNADTIRRLAENLHSRLSAFSGHMEKLGYQLSNSIENFNKAVGSLERNVLPGARKFKDLGANPTKELKELNQIETIVRKPNKE